MATTLQYGRERAHLGRSLLNFMRITRDAHAPELTLGEIGDLLFTAIEVFVGHAFERPMVLGELSRNLEMPRDAVRRKLRRLIEIGLVECIDHRYYMTAKANAPLQREVLLAHLRNMQSAIKEVSKMDTAGLHGIDPCDPAEGGPSAALIIESDLRLSGRQTQD